MNKNELTLGLLDGSERKVTVHVLRTRDSAKVERMRQEAQATPREELDEQILLEMFYPILYFCSEGDPPSPDEFLDMPVMETSKWFEAVDELNPGLLPQPLKEPETEEEADEKKES